MRRFALNHVVAIAAGIGIMLSGALGVAALAGGIDLPSIGSDSNNAPAAQPYNAPDDRPFRIAPDSAPNVQQGINDYATLEQNQYLLEESAINAPRDVDVSEAAAPATVHPFASYQFLEMNVLPGDVTEQPSSGGSGGASRFQ